MSKVYVLVILLNGVLRSTACCQLSLAAQLKRLETIPTSILAKELHLQDEWQYGVTSCAYYSCFKMLYLTTDRSTFKII